MTHQHLIDLLTGHLRDDLSPSQQEQLDLWIAQSERNRLLFESIDDEEQLRKLVLQFHEEEEENNEAIILQKIRQGMDAVVIPVTPVRRFPARSSWGWVAALVIVTTGVGGYIWMNNKERQPVTVAEQPLDIPPGKDGAILTLADGSQVVLDSLGNGVIATQHGTKIVLKNGALAYAQDAGKATAVYNHLSTPKGRQFKLVLPDGTKVWLNAASSLRYPTVFDGNQRQVEISGEAFFEVAQNHQQPFHINVNNQAQIRVLGTQFNVNAYSNEAMIKTTLVDGGIQIKPGTDADNSSFITVKPGQQAQIRQAGKATHQQTVNLLNNANVDKAIAWKSGIFNFEDASLEEVMRQVERWYDIEVVYEKGIPNFNFGGKMGNDVSLSGLLKSLEESEVHFRVEGRKLIVLP
jgi:ferric-dicitrate binding protein FerR (iron transport regulator)